MSYSDRQIIASSSNGRVQLIYDFYYDVYVEGKKMTGGYFEFDKMVCDDFAYYLRLYGYSKNKL